MAACAAIAAVLVLGSFARGALPSSGTAMPSPSSVSSLPRAGKMEPPLSGAYLGVFDPPDPWDPNAVDTFTSLSGKGVAIVMWYQPWAGGLSDFSPKACAALMSRGIVPMITWEPWAPGPHEKALKDPTKQPAFGLSTIVSGRYDGHIREWADQIRSLGGPVMLRPMQEMNGDWYPWAGTVNGNTPALYAQAWRHIHDIFDREGATNVTWVWSVNHGSYPDTADNSYAAYWPGDRYVDWVAVSGFNFGAADPRTRWVTFQSWFGRALAYLRTLHKPVCIAEFGSVEQGGDKAVWLGETYRQIRQSYPFVQAVVYYDTIDQLPSSTQDWRIDSSAASLTAFRQAVAPAYFVGRAPEALSAWESRLNASQRAYLAGLVARR